MSDNRRLNASRGYRADLQRKKGRFVSLTTAVCTLAFTFYTLLAPDAGAAFFSSLNSYFNEHFSWLYVLTGNAVLFYMLWLCCSPYGKISLGGSEARPVFGDIAWYSMIFSAGIGIGIFFYGVAEPIYHLQLPPALDGSGAFDNFKVMFVHWGLHPWAIYGILAIGLGYFS